MRGRLLKFLIPLAVPIGLLLLWAAAETILALRFFTTPLDDEVVPLGQVSLALHEPEPQAYSRQVEVLGHVGSRTFTVTSDGSVLYFGVGRTIAIMDVSDPLHPVMLGQTPTLPATPLHVAIRGGHAYVATGETGLRIFDIRHPGEPRELASYKTTGDAVGVAVIDQVAYVADTQQGLVVLDVSDPSSPAVIASQRISGIVRRVVARNRNLFVVSTAGLTILDAPDPRTLRDVGHYGGLGRFAQEVVVTDKYAYVADGDWGVGIINIADLAKPAIERLYDTPGVARGVAVSGHYLFVADGPGGLRIYDVEDPLKPSEAGFYAAPGQFWAVVSIGNHAYIARGESGLWAFRFVEP